ncbi:MAG: molybdate ABC transporter substrate-binding protein [Oscillospiraceae bacterium]|nr:molybdate ABC transporter substrate-binding protein [Oscillospiraceae bacterium]
MKKMAALCMMLALLTGCSASGGGEKTELVVFAAASLTETLTALGEQYMAENGDVSIVFNFDSSGTLKTQIEEGAVCDVFLSAGQTQMDALAGVYDADTRFDILENKIALVSASDAPAVSTFDELAAALKSGDVLLAAGGADVPVGQYTQKIFDYYALDTAALDALGCVTYSSNVKEVTTQVAESAVDYGIVYATDAFSAGLTVLDTAAAEVCGQVIYPAAALKESANPDAARAFLDFLASDTADAVFEAVGFTPIG